MYVCILEFFSGLLCRDGNSYTLATFTTIMSADSRSSTRGRNEGTFKKEKHVHARFLEEICRLTIGSALRVFDILFSNRQCELTVKDRISMNLNTAANHRVTSIPVKGAY